MHGTSWIFHMSILGRRNNEEDNILGHFLRTNKVWHIFLNFETTLWQHLRGIKPLMTVCSGPTTGASFQRKNGSSCHDDDTYERGAYLRSLPCTSYQFNLKKGYRNRTEPCPIPREKALTAALKSGVLLTGTTCRVSASSFPFLSFF